jgi:hypothetical protein
MCVNVLRCVVLQLDVIDRLETLGDPSILFFLLFFFFFLRHSSRAERDAPMFVFVRSSLPDLCWCSSVRSLQSSPWPAVRPVSICQSGGAIRCDAQTVGGANGTTTTSSMFRRVSDEEGRDAARQNSGRTAERRSASGSDATH